MINCEPVDLSSLKTKTNAKTWHLSNPARYNGTLMPTGCDEDFEKFRNFQVYDDDVWVASFPKSGAIWVEEMVWSILYGFEETKSHLGVRFPMIDYNFLIPKKMRTEEFISMEKMAQSPRPRFIETHVGYDLWPRQLQQKDCKAKIIYVTRNPRDTCISYYYEQRCYLNYDGSLEQFTELFLKDLVIFGPYWKNVLSFWNHRHRSNVLVVRYEDMKSNLSEVIVRVSEFLDKPLSKIRIKQLCDHLDFVAMKNNPLVNDHWKPWYTDEDRSAYELIRVGKVNQWIEELSEEQKKDFEKWEKENLKDTDYPLDYDDLRVY